MFQIFDTNNKPIGRPQGYAKHSTAERLIKRKGKIRSAIYTEFYKAPEPEFGGKLLWSIRWIEK